MWWTYGTCRNRIARKHWLTGEVQFVLWKAGEHDHDKDYWILFHSDWWSEFKPNKPMKKLNLSHLTHPYALFAIGWIAGMLLVTTSIPLNWYPEVDWYPTTEDVWPAVIGIILMNISPLRMQIHAHHKKITEKNKSPYHGWASLIRLVPIVGFTMIIHAWAWNWLQVFLLSAVAASFWGIFFNPLLNDKLDKDTFFIDRDGNGSIIDNFLFKSFGKKGGVIFFAFCILCVILFTWMYIKSFNL